MKQTAVDWLQKELHRRGPIGEEMPIWVKELFDQAKAMEKEQIIDAYGHGQNNGYVYAFDKAITINREQYYTETFKSE